MIARVRRFARRLLGFLRYGAEEAELARELAAHIDLVERDLLGRGVTREQARIDARRAFDGLELTKERQREARSFAWLEDARRDASYALRSLVRSPGFAAAAVLTLAVGVGANTAVFSLIDGLLLRPLPVPRTGELVLFGKARNWGIVSGVARNYDVFSYPQYLYFRRNDRSFPGGLAGFASWQAPVQVRTGASTAMSNGKLVSGNYFSVLGVEPAAGRLLDDGDDRAGAAPVAVLSSRYWASRFNRAPDVVNRTLVINGTPFTVVGVAAAGFFGETLQADPPDLWFPLARFPEVTLNPSILDQGQLRWLHLMGRTPRPDLEQLTAVLTVRLHQWLDANEPARDQPDVRAAIERSIVEASAGATGISHLRNQYGEPLEILLAIAALVLVIACGNVANLLLARAAARRREMSLRLALGASLARILRQLVAESLLLCALGGAAGIALAYWATDGLLRMVFRDATTYGITVAPDGRILAFAVLVVVVSGVLFGIAPGWRAACQDAGLAVKASGRAVTGGGRGFTIGRLLVAAQVALSLLLLVASGLLVRSVRNLSRQDFGFDRDHILLVHVDPRAAGYRPDQLAALYQRIEDAVNAVPGVRRSALALYTPLSGQNWDSAIAVAGYGPERDKNLDAVWMRVTPDYFDAMGMPLLAGRRFGPVDTARTPQTVVVNESFVHDVLHGENPIGRRFGFDEARAGDWEIVGVVRDTKHNDPRALGEPTFFLPITAVPSADPVLTRSTYLRDLVVRSAREPGSVAVGVRQALDAVDDRLVVTGVTTMDEQVRQSYNQQELMGVLSTVFGAVALLLAAIGLYGLMAYSVARRSDEIAVRMALGAEGRQVVWMIEREILVLLGAGLAVGIPLVVGATRLIRAQLFGIGALDPATIAAAVALLALLAAVSGYIPARRAAHLDPATALRDA